MVPCIIANPAMPLHRDTGQVGADAKLNRSQAPWTVVLPEGGVSALDMPGAPFHDPDANQALFETLESDSHLSDCRRIIRSPLHINDPDFAAEVVGEYLKLAAD